MQEGCATQCSLLDIFSCPSLVIGQTFGQIYHVRILVRHFEFGNNTRFIFEIVYYTMWCCSPHIFALKCHTLEVVGDLLQLPAVYISNDTDKSNLQVNGGSGRPSWEALIDRNTLRNLPWLSKRITNNVIHITIYSSRVKKHQCLLPVQHCRNSSEKIYH